MSPKPWFKGEAATFWRNQTTILVVEWPWDTSWFSFIFTTLTVGADQGSQGPVMDACA